MSDYRLGNVWKHHGWGRDIMDAFEIGWSFFFIQSIIAGKQKVGADQCKAQFKLGLPQQALLS